MLMVSGEAGACYGPGVDGAFSIYDTADYLHDDSACVFARL